MNVPKWGKSVLSKKRVRGGGQEYHVSHITPIPNWVLKDEYSSKFPKSVNCCPWGLAAGFLQLATQTLTHPFSLLLHVTEV